MNREAGIGATPIRDSLPTFGWWRSFRAAMTSPVALLDGLTWRGIGYLFAASAACTLIDVQWWWLRVQNGVPQEALVELWPAWFVRRLLTFGSQWLALVIANNLRWQHVSKPTALALALLAGSLVAALPYTLARSHETASDAFIDLLNITLTGFVFSGVFVLAFFAHRHDIQIAELLQRAELERVALRKKTLESDLQLMQARVEPQFLFSTLRRLGDLYERDRNLADRMLENLIVYLRAALPKLRCTQSSLAQEVRLAQAYLNIENIRLRGQLDTRFDLPVEIASLPFPAMVLLPMIQALSLRAPESPAETVTLSIEARADRDVLALRVERTGPGEPAPDEFANLRERIHALHADAVGPDVEQSAPHRVVATLRVPLSGLYVAADAGTLRQREADRAPT